MEEENKVLEDNTEILDDNVSIGNNEGLNENVEEPLPEINTNEGMEEPLPEVNSEETPVEEPTEAPVEEPVETPVEDNSIAMEETPVEDNSTMMQDNPIDMNETNTTPVSPIEEPSDKKEKKKGKKAPVIIILLLLIAIGVGVYFYLTNSKSGKVESPKKESAYRISGNDLTDFDLKFLQIENSKKNKIYSPLSIKYALAMLKEGAKGDTKTQITDIIGDYKARKYVNNKNMSFANGMFIKDTYKDSVKQTYVDNLKENYNAEVIYDTFKTPDNLNKWVSDKTFGLIKDLFNDVSNFDYTLVNALAIDMNWNNQIQCATGSKVPCKEYGGNYAHEKGEDGNIFTWGLPIIDSPAGYHSLKFDGKDNIKSVEIGAVYNRYDIIKELGEDKIRKTVGEEYKKWLNNPDTQEMERLNPGTVEKDVNKYLDGYIADLKENYNKSDDSTDFLFHDDKNVKVFAKDLKTYDGTTLQYVGIMPKKEDLDKYVEKTNAKKINKIIKNLKEIKKESFKDGVVTKIYGYIPLFKYDYELNLTEDLNKLGIKDVFDEDKADLSNLTSEKSYIADAAHKANIEFSNDGIKAAAATQESGFGSTGGGFEYLFDVPIEKIDLTFDKPYMFIIRDKESGEVWFTGTVYEPIKK